MSTNPARAMRERQSCPKVQVAIYCQGYDYRGDDNVQRFMKFIAKSAKYDMVLYTNESGWASHVWDCDRTIVFVARGYPQMKNVTNCPTISLLEDDNLYAWHAGWHMNFQYIFYNYHSYHLDQWKMRCRHSKFWQFRHYVDNTLFKDWQLEKEYDILLFGAIYRGIRGHLNHVLTNTSYGERFRVRVIGLEEGLSRETLSQEINKSWMTVVGRVDQFGNWFVKKYFETAMSRSIPLGNYPDLEHNVFRVGDESYMVNMDVRQWTPQKIEDQVAILEYYLKNESLLEKMSDGAYNAMLDCCTYDRGVERFEELIDRIIKENVAVKVSC